MDGVLIDACEWHYTALNRALVLFDYAISRESHDGEFDGLPIREKLHRLSLRKDFPFTMHSFINDMKQRYTLEAAKHHCRIDLTQQQMLSVLVGDGYKLVVASNSIRASIEVMLGQAGILPYLEFFLSNEDVRQGKPDPEIYDQAISRLGVAPEDCVIVEDNPHGIAAAKAAGAHLLGVRGPSDVTLEGIRGFIARIT